MADRKKVNGFEPTTQGNQTEVRIDLIKKILVSKEFSSDWFALAFIVWANKYWFQMVSITMNQKLKPVTIPNHPLG